MPMFRRLVFSATALALCQTAEAVVVLSGATNDTAPSGQPYFQNVGTVGGGSAIYLGNGWVATAAHVAGSLPAGATFAGTTYTTQAGTFHRLNNPIGSGLSTLTDIVLFRLGVHPGLPSITIASTTPTVAAPVMMIGAGRLQASAPTYWQVTEFPGNGNDIWNEQNSPFTDYGFKTTATRGLRWGENSISAVNQTINYGVGHVRMFFTDFDAGALTHEAQAVSGDSGGAVLSHDGASWVLSGIMLAVGTFDMQPANTAVVGNITASADLTFYRDQILRIIPEPSATALCLICIPALLTRRR